MLNFKATTKVPSLCSTSERNQLLWLGLADHLCLEHACRSRKLQNVLVTTALQSVLDRYIRYNKCLVLDLQRRMCSMKSQEHSSPNALFTGITTSLSPNPICSTKNSLLSPQSYFVLNKPIVLFPKSYFFNVTKQATLPKILFFHTKNSVLFPHILFFHMHTVCL